MNQYDESGGDDQSEDGQLRTPDNEYLDSQEEGEDTADSLDIKPPQAARSNARYRDKKSSKDKRHSKEHKHKDRDREARDRERDDRRHRHRERDVRHHGLNTGRGISGKMDRELNRYEGHLHQRDRPDHYGRSSNLTKNDNRSGDRSRNDRNERDRDRRKESPDNKSEADRVLEDLRSRLLNKRNKFESEKGGRGDDSRVDAIMDQYESRRSEKETINRYDHYETRKDRQINDKRDYYSGNRDVHSDHPRRDIIEVIDSPEYYGDLPQSVPQQKMSRSDQSRHQKAPLIEDKEQAARRAKLLEAEREMARRKELAREELEARRELRRERDETKTQPSEIEGKRKRHLYSDEELIRKKIKDNIDKEENVVTVSDQSDDDTNSDTGSSMSDDSHNASDEGELPGSPLSIGDLSKSDRRHRNSRSVSRSRSKSISQSHSRSLSPSRSRSNSISKSKSRSHSPHSISRTRSNSPHSRSHSKSPVKSDDDKEMTDVTNIDDKTTEKTKEEEEAAIEKEEKEKLPSYYPALQGCRSVEEFQCLNRIEEGTYGVVYRAKDKRTEEIVALKRLKMEKEKEGFPITSLREINTLLKGQHPNIVTVREIVVGSNMDKIFIVMDYVEHDLKSLMDTMKHKKQAFLPAEVKCLTQQLLRAVGHLHDNWILHRDLKTSNLLLSHKGILKVGDFGLAREYGSPLKPYTSVVVTLWYRAPELLLCCKEYSTPIDIWSVGCIFAEFLSMTALFPGKSEIDQLNRIFKDLGTPNEKIWPGYNELPAVQKMTFTDYPVSQLRKKFAHLTSELGLSLLQGLLTYDPKQRLSADQALKNSYFKEQPFPIDPSMFPTWPAKSELGVRKALASSPKPPSGGGQFKQLGEGDGADHHGFHLGTSLMEARQLAMGPGFSLKF